MWSAWFLASQSFYHQESNQSGGSSDNSLLNSYASYVSIPSMEFDTSSKFKEIQASLAKLDAVSLYSRWHACICNG